MPSMMNVRQFFFSFAQNTLFSEIDYVNWFNVQFSSKWVLDQVSANCNSRVWKLRFFTIFAKNAKLWGGAKTERVVRFGWKSELLLNRHQLAGRWNVNDLKMLVSILHFMCTLEMEYPICFVVVIMFFKL